MRALPSVSVCIPVYRGEQFLAETIRSVLDQTYRDFELVVLDNASPDDSGRIARSFGDHRIRVETNLTTLPQPENWREAVRLCRAPLIKLLCADDLLHPRCLEYQVGPMEADPGLAVVAARRHMIDERSRVLVPRRGLIGLTGVRSSVEVARHVVRSGANPIGEPGGVLFRRAHYFAVGGWRPDHRFVMDLDLWIRLLQHGEFLGLPETARRVPHRPGEPLGGQRGHHLRRAEGLHRGARRHFAPAGPHVGHPHGPDARPAGPGAAACSLPDVALRGAPGRATARDGRHLTFCRTSFAADTDTRLA